MALTRITKGVIKPNENYDTHNINSTGIVTAIGLDVNGNGDISGNLSVGGVLTYEDVTSIDSVGIITAQKDIHVGAGVSAVGVGTFGSLDISGDIDVDGHTNLDNVSIAGVTTMTGALTISSTTDQMLNLNSSDNNGTSLAFQRNSSRQGYIGYGGGSSGLIIANEVDNGDVAIQGKDGGSSINMLSLASHNKGLATLHGGATIPLDLDVDGHTNLDNVSIAGVTTTTGNVNVGVDLDVTDDITLGGEFNMIGSSDNNKYFDARIGSSNKLIFRSSSGGAGNLVTMLQLGVNGSSLVGNFALGASSDSSSAAGPEFTLNRNSSSPANADYLGQIKFAGRSSTGVQRNYAKITGKILDVTNGSEDGILEFSHIRNGSQAITGRWRSDSLQLLNDTNLSVAGDTTLTGDLDVDGHTNLDNISVAGVSTFTGNATFSGNIGVNQTEPAYKLVVNEETTVGTAHTVLSALNPIVYIDAGNEVDHNIVLKKHTTSNGDIIGGLLFASSPDGANYNWTGIKAIQDTNGAAESLVFYTSTSNTGAANSTEVVRIKGSEVGIGTDNPQEDLHIGSNSPYILLDDYDNSRKWRVKGTAWFAIEDATASEDKLKIDTNGNFTFYNKAAAWNTLQRANAAHYIGLRIQETNGTQRMQFGVAGNINDIVSGSAQHDVVLKAYDANLILATNATEKLRITSGGNVVIGHSAANAKLHIASGTSSAVGDATNPAFQIGATGNYRFAIHTTNEQAIIANKNGDDGIAFHTKTASGGSFGEALRIMSSGKIKLGSGGDVVGSANVEIRYDNPVLLIRDTAENSADGDAKIAFGNNSHYPTAFISHTWDGNDGSLTFHTRVGGSEAERLRIKSDGSVSYRTGGGKGYDFNSSGSSAGIANMFAPASYTLAFGTNNTERLRIENVNTARARFNFGSGNNDMTNPDIGGGTSGVSINKNTLGQIYSCTDNADNTAANDYQTVCINVSRRNTSGDGPQIALDRGGWIKSSIAGLQGSNTATSGPGIFAVYTHDYSSGANVRTERLRISGSNGNVAIGDDNSSIPRKLWVYEASNDPYIRIQRGSTSNVTMGGFEIASSNGNGNNVLATMLARSAGNSGTKGSMIFQVRNQAANHEVMRLMGSAQGAIQGNRMLVNGNQVMVFGGPHGTSGTQARDGNVSTYNSVYEHSNSSYRTTDNGMFGGTFVVSGNASYWYPVWFSLPTNCPPQELWINKYVHNYATWDGALFFRASLSGTGYGAYTVQHRVHFYSSSSKNFIGKIIYTGHNNAFIVCWMLGGGRSYGWGTVGGNGINVNVGDDGNSHNLGPGNTSESYITSNLSIPQGYEQAMTTSGMHQQSDGF